MPLDVQFTLALKLVDTMQHPCPVHSSGTKMSGVIHACQCSLIRMPTWQCRKKNHTLIIIIVAFWVLPWVQQYTLTHMSNLCLSLLIWAVIISLLSLSSTDNWLSNMKLAHSISSYKSSLLVHQTLLGMFTFCNQSIQLSCKNIFFSVAHKSNLSLGKNSNRH